MIEHPVYVKRKTEHERPYFENISAAEATITALVDAQAEGWLRLHGFIVLPSQLEMVFSPIRQGISGIMAYLESEMIPVLNVLLPEALMIWSPAYSHKPILTQVAMNARLEMLALAPVALGLSAAPEAYTFSYVNTRYSDQVTRFTGFARTLPPDNDAHITGINPIVTQEFGRN